MISHYLTIKKDGEHEIEIKKSRFICHLFRIDTEEQAKVYIQYIKKTHWKATHHCTAYVLGDKQEIQRSNDDGEPGGTAGIPMLEILKKRQVINTLAVVTRYFGGTELGTGGLIRAYGGAVATAIDEVGIVEARLQQTVQVVVSYPNHSRLENFLIQQNYTVKSTDFTEIVTVTCMVDENHIETFSTSLIDLLSGQVEISLGNLEYVELPVSK